MGNLQPNPSSSTQTTEKKYEVFLNFRGVDTRDGFTSYLYKALRAKSIETFMDDHGIPKGDVIGPELLKAIRDSMISVVIFSKEYASSKWCLRELVEIMKSAKTVIPVFYKVSVADVGDLKGSFMIGFDKLKKRFDEKLEKEQLDSVDFEKRKKEFDEEMQKWRQALEDASHVKGWSYENGPEIEVIDKIVKDIWEKLGRTYKLSSCDFKGLFGIEERLEQVQSLLCLGKTDIRIIGIWGMGGLGKTTIADVVYHQIPEDEYGKCFVGNLRQRLEQCGGLVRVLQQEVLSKVLNDQDIKLEGVTLPEHIKERLRKKKIFIVLDDVDNFLKLEELAAGLDGLGAGSRIIITTRNRDVLHNCRVNNDYIYEVKGLSHREAFQLFCKYAQPTADCLRFSYKIVRSINGNPLGLKVAGSSLLVLNKLEWQSALSGLKKSSKILEVLQISYDKLEQGDRDIFLDIACFFVGKHKDYVAKILDNCLQSLKVLSNRSLITISNDNIIQMHDLLQEMGMEIVRKEDLNNPSNRSRLWTQEDVLDTLKNDDGTNAIRGIFLNMSNMDEEHLSSETFKKMKNLRLFKFYDSTFHGSLYCDSKLYSSNVLFPNDISYLSNKLWSLNWLGYPLKALPSNFIPRELVELELRHSNIEKLWERNTRAPKLKSISLGRCPYLIKASGLVEAPQLERIDIHSCNCLLNIEICQSLLDHRSCNHFPALKYLRLLNCDRLTQISDLLDAQLLEEIDIKRCTNLRDFPSPAHHFDNLRKFYMTNCDNLQSFPNCPFPSLVSLDLSWCKNLQSFPNCPFPSLVSLNLSRCENLQSFPNCPFPSLVSLDLSWCENLQSFPNCPFPSLVSLDLSRCENLQSFPNCPFPSLVSLDLFWCENLQSFPNCPFPSLVSLGLFRCINLARISDPLNAPLLEKIDLEHCESLQNFPTPACHFNNLRELNLSNCKNLEIFPNNIPFSSLVSLDLSGCIKLAKISDVLDAPLLEEINLDDCKSLLDFPRPAQHFNNLRNLYLENCKNVPSFPSDNIHFPSLKCLDFHRCIKLTEFPHISGNIEKLFMRKTAIHQVPSTIENLPELVELVLADCPRLNHISSSIGKLKALRNLDLSNCSALECFPEISDTMRSLKNLDLSGTAIKWLHHLIENLSGLQVLCLRECENLDDVPSSIENLTELVALDLQGCTSLKHISFNICKLKALRTLNFSYSALECFPEISDIMGNLKFLDLSGTAIKGLHHSIENLSGLEMLYLIECKSLEMLPNSIYNLTSLHYLNLSYCSKLENLPGNSVTDLSKCGESSTTKPPICRLIKCYIHFTNCLNLNKTAVINLMELQINQHRDMTTKGYGTQAVDLQFFCPGSEVPGWFKHQTDGSSINIQMSGHDDVNGHLIGLAAYAIIEFHDDDHDVDGHDDEGLGDESYDDDGSDEDGITGIDEDGIIRIVYKRSCHCKHYGDWIGNIGRILLNVIPYEDENSDHVALWYSNKASVLELCDECTNYIFQFDIVGRSANCIVKYCGVCPIYGTQYNAANIANETCGAVSQDFGNRLLKERGKIRKFSDEAETSGRSIEDVIEPHPKRTCSYSNPNSL